jgi:3-oxoacyl-(acyl-carrier-protein) synthase
VDAAERAAILHVFGARAASIPLVTLTPSIGNCGAGNGAIAAAVAARCVAEQRLPARLNTKGAIGLDADACASRAATVGTVLVFTPSLGGQNAAAIIRSIA